MSDPKQRVFHITQPESVPDILENGLKINSVSHFTKAGEWADAHYGCRPVYVSTKATAFAEFSEAALLELQVESGALAADLPSLVDYGAYVEEDGIWFEETPNSLAPFEEDDLISFKDLLTVPELITACIQLTKTAAVCQDIAPADIKVVEKTVTLGIE